MDKTQVAAAKTHILFVAHGSRVPRWNEVANEFREQVGQAIPACAVEICFLTFGEPAFEEAIETAIAAGCKTLLIQPLLLAPGGHILDDIDGRLKALESASSGVSIQRLGTLLELTAVRSGLIRAVDEALNS